MFAVSLWRHYESEPPWANDSFLIEKHVWELSVGPVWMRSYSRGFHKHTSLAIMPILASETLLHENKKKQWQNVTSSGHMNLWFQVQHYPFWANWTFACKTETLGSLYSHALLIPTKSFKSKNQVMHEQKFKDLLSSTWPLSSSQWRVLDLESEVNQRPRFYPHYG